MPLSDPLPQSLPTAAPPPSTPLGPFLDSALAWASWTTAMAFVGLVVLALLVAGPSRRVGAATHAEVRTRLTAAAVAAGVLAGPASLAALAHDAAGAPGGGYDYNAAWAGLFDGTAAGLLSGLQVTLPLLGAALLVPVARRRAPAARVHGALLWSGLTAGLIALGSARFPTQVRNGLGRTVFETVVWMAHLFGAAVWLGGLVGLLLLALPGAVVPADRAAFWAPAVRRFSLAAMACVAAITLSGLFLYWEHVDGPGQLFSTMYGRVLGVKILIFGAVLLLGAFNQFWLHPRIDALRTDGEAGRAAGIALRRFPVVVAAEVALVLLVLFVAPFLHGSARNQAYQAYQAQQSEQTGQSAVGDAPPPKLPPKQASASTWAYGSAETAAVIAVMLVGYRCSGRLARRRSVAAEAATAGARC
ncbi:CopD family protein [Streptacidiphilus fuscans]|uniref:CopD family protein n=1 Tax=Streptacidiphilus fuscans TaxID=2789292 RepID=A0A931B5C5_9ACTN|nr:CopD family protein [Streptacidiphilus fuscans]MBF9067185.1 CopD family protein [Streptacidiphilus fuscans]